MAVTLKPHVKPNRWSCLATSFSIALGIDTAEFTSHIGHDGSEILYPSLPDPSCRRGFHPQEAIDVCLAHGVAATPIELYPSLLHTRGGEPFIVRFGDNEERFRKHVFGSIGVLECIGRQYGHAFTVDHGTLIDPDDAQTYPYVDLARRGLQPLRYWRLTWA